MNIFDLKPKRDTITVELKSKVGGEPLLNDDGSPMTWTKYLPHTKQHKELLLDQQDELIKNKQEEITARQAKKMSVDRIVKTTKEWNITGEDGEKLEFTEELAYELLDWPCNFAQQIFMAEAELEDFT